MTIPNGGNITLFELSRLFQWEAEFDTGVMQDVVDSDEDGCTKFDGLGGVVKDVNSESSTADSMFLFKNGDVDIYPLLLSVLL